MCWGGRAQQPAWRRSAGLRPESNHNALDLLLSSEAYWRAEIWNPWPLVVLSDVSSRTKPR